MILITYGTRPEYIKIKPLIKKMTEKKIPFRILFTGQHKDIVDINADFILEFSELSTNRLDNILINCLKIPDHFFDNISHVLVQGDTTSVLGLSLASFHRKISIIHLEAGLRSFDKNNPFPEENNRRIVSSLSSLHLCPTEQNKNNLLNEGVDEDKIFVVGNTGLDNLKQFQKKITYKNKVLVTLHRRENHELMEEWFTELNRLSIIYKEIEFILPIHPNPNVMKHRNLLTNINVVDPLNHDELLKILVECKLVISDSGGIQEECSFLNKKCLVCRTSTERIESLGLTSFLVKKPSNLVDVFEYHIKHANEINGDCPFGDGNSSERICEIFEKLFF